MPSACLRRSEREKGLLERRPSDIWAEFSRMTIVSALLICVKSCPHSALPSPDLVKLRRRLARLSRTPLPAPSGPAVLDDGRTTIALLWWSSTTRASGSPRRRVSSVQGTGLLSYSWRPQPGGRRRGRSG